MTTSTEQFTPIDHIADIVASARAAYDGDLLVSVDDRLDLIRTIRSALLAESDAIEAALAADLGRPTVEAWGADIGVTVADIDHTLANLPRWAQPRKVPTPVALQPASSYVQPGPLGVACVISPWNYPVQLSILPVVAAISAGNAVVLKPSELAPASAAVLEAIVQTVDSPALQIVQGGVAETTRLLEQRFDHILYTGNPNVAKIVMRAAAEHLTPVTLELGGKSPVVVTANANLEVAANRIAWGRLLNAGQTCLACDYVLVEDQVHDELIERLRSTITRFYGADPKSSPDFGRIVNEQHFNRIEKLMGDGITVIGGATDIDSLYIEPTVITDVTREDPILQEEIFGPVLPVVRVGGVDEAIEYINADEKPLALYVFSDDDDEVERVLSRTSSGGAMANGALMHAANPHLPFGGVGNSGMGAYHGKHGFEAFSHQRAVMALSTKIDNGLLYPPFSSAKVKLLKRAIVLPDPRDMVAKLRLAVRRRLPF